MYNFSRIENFQFSYKCLEFNKNPFGLFQFMKLILIADKGKRKISEKSMKDVENVTKSPHFEKINITCLFRH